MLKQTSTSPITLLDGGLGRELEARGAPFRQPEWSALCLIDPDAHHFVVDTHLAYLNAGASVITTNSYAITPFHIGERFDTSSEALVKTAGRLARQAVDDFMASKDKQSDEVNEHPLPKVAGSLPPLFGSYRPELFDADNAYDLAKPLIVGQQDDVDLWLIETTASILEAKTWLTSLAQFDMAKHPIWLSFTLADDELSEDEANYPTPKLRSGETVSEMITQVLAWQASGLDVDLGQAIEAILFNCSQPEVMTSALKVANNELQAQNSPLKLGVYANAFASKQSAKQANHELRQMRADTTPEGYGESAKQWIEAGASIIGGCCGIGVAHIAHLHQVFATEI